MAKAVKLADIAEKLNVSAVTVSKALSGQKGVSEEMREKIKALANELGYRPPNSSKKEEKASGYSFGMLIAERYLDKYDSFYGQMYQQVIKRATAKDCFALLEVIDNEMVEKLQIPKLAREQKVDGIIIIGKLGEAYLEYLNKNLEIPLVYLDFCDDKQDTDAVISDSFYGAYRLTNYLFDMGHTQIAYVGTLLSTSSITDRYLGYCKSLLEHKQAICPDWVIDDRSMVDGFIYEDDKIVFPQEMPTAFFCNCDLTASTIIRKLKNMGYRVPEDISVVGYDNYIYPGLCEVAITTYEVDIKEMAKRAIHILIKKIEQNNYRPGISIVEGHMVVKNSVKNILV